MIIFLNLYFEVSDSSVFKNKTTSVFINYSSVFKNKTSFYSLFLTWIGFLFMSRDKVKAVEAKTTYEDKAKSSVYEDYMKSR